MSTHQKTFTEALEAMMRAHGDILENPCEETLRAFVDASGRVKQLHQAVELASFERLLAAKRRER